MGSNGNLSPVSMVCSTCQAMLYRQQGRRGTRTTLEVDFDHHETEHAFVRCVRASSCYICRVISDRLQIRNGSPRAKAQPYCGRTYLTAVLRTIQQRDSTFRLDFRIHNEGSPHSKRPIASFILVGRGEPPQLASDDFLQTPVTPIERDSCDAPLRPTCANTADPAVTVMAKAWIAECVQNHPECNDSSPSFYPTRLVEIASANGATGPHGAVRVVSKHENERQPGQPEFKDKYVTLSHCWGKKPFLKLTRESLKRFQDALHLDDLPLTFRHAVTFARQLGVRWIWIDALCIVQNDEQDWLTQARSMSEVYTNSYCNISATDAADSSKGLFRPRDPDRDWAQLVTIKVKDPAGLAKEIYCTVLDLAFWERYVEQAPVNRRSWVLQERLLAPRVLHYCQDQIAFECRRMDRAECRPEGLPHLLMMRGQLVEGARLKRIEPGAGKELRSLRLRKEYSTSNEEKLASMINEVKPTSRWHYYEVWKRVIELYTRLELTKPKDRLIALSGIARMLKEKMEADGIEDEYIAGLWQKGLASQLLWYVNEVDGINPQPFENNRPKNEDGSELKRAPSFSWASVETARGVTFPDITKQGIRIQIEVVRLLYQTPEDNFGILADGYIVIKGVLRRIHLTDRQAHTEPTQVSRAVYLAHHLRQLARPWVGNTRRKIDLEVPARNSIIALHFTAFACIIIWHAFLLRPTWYSTPPSLLVWIAFGVAILRPAIVEQAREEDDAISINRWAWQLMREGKPEGREYSVVYLDSPASEPSIFDDRAQVFVIPALQTRRYLFCLMVQAVEGDHGIRYRRIGLTVISNEHEQEVQDIMTPPTRSDIIQGRYYWGAEGKKSGESTICII